MALPVTGGDNNYPPFRPYSARGPVSYYPAKRRPAESIAADGNDPHSYGYHDLPQKRLRYDGPVAFRAVAEPLPVNPPMFLHHPLSYHLLPPPKHHPSFPSPVAPLPSPEPAAGPAAAPPAMERTASGHSILPDPTKGCAATELLDDLEAAQRVRDHLATFRRRNPDSKQERILRNIIKPRRRGMRTHRRHHPVRGPSASPSGAAADLPDGYNDDDATEDADDDEETSYPIDNDALESIFSAANDIFFNGRLSQRVAWDWSHASASRFDHRVIGTTALRRASARTRGFETLIVLSSPILRDPRYSRRLLISTFLHELIHCYLFICCGFRARDCGGHTAGFRDIAAVIDEWIGDDGAGLFLTRMEADLELFLVDRGRGRRRRVEEETGAEAVREERRDWGGFDGGGNAAWHGGRGGGVGDNPTAYYPCSGMAGTEQDGYRDSPSPAAGSSGHPYPGQGFWPKQEPVYIGRRLSDISPSPSPGPGLGAAPPTNSLDTGAQPYTYNFNHTYHPSEHAVWTGGSGRASRGGSRSNSPAWQLRHRRPALPPPQPPTRSSSAPSPSSAYTGADWALTGPYVYLGQKP